MVHRRCPNLAAPRKLGQWSCRAGLGADVAFKMNRIGMRQTKTRNRGTAWRHVNIGRLLNNAIRRFEARVLDLMSESGHAETRISHVNLTRNLDVEGTRLTELARRASMSKQAMGELVDQCAALGLVIRAVDPSDRRARIVTFTAAGLEWLDAFRAAVDVAEAEMRAELGAKVMDVIMKGLMNYGAEFDTLDLQSGSSGKLTTSVR